MHTKHSISRYVTYRGAVYRKADETPALKERLQLDRQIMQAVLHKLVPLVSQYQKRVQKIIDSVIADANRDMQEELSEFNKKLTYKLIEDIISELFSGAGSDDDLTKRRAVRMGHNLYKALTDDALTATELASLLGWGSVTIPPIKFNDLTQYFDASSSKNRFLLDHLLPKLQPHLS